MELIEIVLEDGCHWRNRLNDIGNGQFSAFGFSNSRYQMRETTLTKEQVVAVTDDGIFMVESQSDPNTYYNVNMRTGLCECPSGRNHGPCVHKSAIAKHHNQSEFSVVPETDGAMRAMYHYIASGDKNIFAVTKTILKSLI